MLYQVIIATGLVLFVLNLTLNLRSIRRPPPDVKLARPAPSVSVLIPARDEEVSIGACLESLRRQDYPDFEVLVLDDNSTDSTARIVAAEAAADSRIQLIRGEPLLEGCAGKPFACHQLAQRARGDWLLFVDADTTHTPDMLRRVISLVSELKNPRCFPAFPGR